MLPLSPNVANLLQEPVVAEILVKAKGWLLLSALQDPSGSKVTLR